MIAPIRPLTDEEVAKGMEEAVAELTETLETKKRQKQVYVGAPAIFALELACQHICDAYESWGCYLVGSALERADWRDIDLRLIVDDADFAREFPNVDGRTWEHDSKWLLTVVSISAWLKQQTGLPVDFQIQPQTHANEVHKGPRNAIGLKIRKQVSK